MEQLKEHIEVRLPQPREQTEVRADPGRQRWPAPLPRRDVRERLDQAVRRGWREIAWQGVRLAILLAADTMAGTAAAALLWFGFGLGPDLNPTLLLPSLALIQPLALGVSGAYGSGQRRMSFDRIVRGLVLAVALVGLQVVVLDGVDHARLALFLGAYLVAAAGSTQLARVGVDRLVKEGRRRGLGQRRLLVVGTEDQTERVLASLAGRSAPDVAIVGRLSPTSFREPGAVGTVDDLEAAVFRTGAHGIVVDSALTFDHMEELIHQSFDLGIAVMVMPQMLHQLGARLDLRSSDSGAMLQVQPPALRVPQLAVKRTMDVVLSSLLMLISAPLWLAIAAAIKVEGGGPVLFNQVRAGLGGRPFQMYKFRTMVVDADHSKEELQNLNESGDPRLFKIKDDPRVTRVGRFLRKFSLDEIPQLLNILKGEMSLVGPRPFFPEDMAGYEDHHMERLWVLPGITGLWQVSGRSDVVDFEEVVRLDREYIRHWSIWMDLSILIRTLPAAIARNGAY